MSLTALSTPDPDNVRHLAAKITTHYIHVTPEIAARWLRSNTINRNIRTAKVNQYARDMAEGRWTISNDDICFDPDGKLLNGQHRLNAVVKSGTTVLMGVKRNVPREAMANMDSGASRTPADVLRFSGEKNAALLGSTLKQIVLLGTGRMYQDSKVQAVSRGEQVQALAECPEVRHSVNIATRYKPQIDAPPTAVALAHFIIAARHGSDLADHYIGQLARRIGEPEGSAVHAVDSRLREVRRHRQKYPVRNFVYLLIKGWNYYSADKPVQKLQMGPKLGSPFRIPEPGPWRRS